MALSIPLLFVVSALSFVLVSLEPGDPARIVLGSNSDYSQAQLVAVRHELGLDLPIHEQYWRWLRHAVTGDFGVSIYSREPVGHLIHDRLPVTVSLVGASLLVTVIVGVGMGVFSAIRGRAGGRFVDMLGLLGLALPGFWVGAMLLALFAVKLQWLPAQGYVPLTTSPSDWIKSLILPVAALSLAAFASLAKQTREAMLDVLASEHVRMAWANGLSPFVVYSLAFRNALIRVVTIVGLQLVGLLAGTAFVEQVFGLPGLGAQLVNAAIGHDLPEVQGIAVLFSMLIVLTNLAVDIVYTQLDPRVTHR